MTDLASIVLAYHLSGFEHRTSEARARVIDEALRAVVVSWGSGRCYHAWRYSVAMDGTPWMLDFSRQHWTRAGAEDEVVGRWERARARAR